MLLTWSLFVPKGGAQVPKGTVLMVFNGINADHKNRPHGLSGFHV
jgi:hypothetical protein